MDLKKDEGIRHSISQKIIERLPPVLPDGIINAAIGCLFNNGSAFIIPADEATAKKTIVTLHLMKTLEHFDEHYGIASVPSAGEIASAILLERIK